METHLSPPLPPLQIALAELLFEKGIIRTAEPL